MKRILSWIALGSVMGPLAAAAQQTTTPAQPATTSAQRFRLTASTLQLVPGEPGGTVTVTVLARFQPADERPKGEATLTDETPNATGVTVTAAPVKTTDAEQQTWRFTVEVKGLPKNSTQARAFVLAYGKFSEKLDYTLTNVNSTAFAWSVKAATEWNVESQKAFEIPLRIGDVPATNVSLHQVALVSEDKLKHTLGSEHFQLCSKVDGTRCDALPSSLAPRTPYTLYLLPGPLPPGVFKGTVSLAATEKTEPEVLTLTLYSPSPDGKKYGIVALTAGVLLALVLQVIAPNLLQQQREKQAVALLGKRLGETKSEFNKLPDPIKRAAAPWMTSAGNLETDLAKLNDLVRGFIPVPFQQEVAAVETLKTEMERLGAVLAFLQLLLREGLEKVVAIQIQFPKTPAADVAAAAAKIALVQAGDSAAEDIKTIVGDLLTRIGVDQPARLAAAPRKASETFEMQRLQILAVSLVAWIIWAALSIMTGALLFVFQSPGFGTPMDLALCFAWGAGITFAGQQATQMTPGAVATSLGVKLPGK